MWARMCLVLGAILASLVLTGAGQVNHTTVGPEQPSAARAVVAITQGDADHAGIPSDFADVMGYQPEVVIGPDGSQRIIQPHGDCSSPFGPTPYDFGFACKAHDYGYDLLRYATAKGGELGPWARMAIDDQFAADLHDRCARGGGGSDCRVAATVSDQAVKLNSWRQGQGNPGREDPVPYLASGMLILLAIVGPLVLARLQRVYAIANVPVREARATRHTRWRERAA